MPRSCTQVQLNVNVPSSTTRLWRRLPLFARRFRSLSSLVLRGCHRGCGHRCCLWAEAWPRVGNVFLYVPQGNSQEAPQHFTTRPEEAPPGTPHNQPPPTSSSPEACRLTTVTWWCFFLLWFLSGSGTLAIKWLTHIGSWLTLASFHLKLFNEFPLVFPDTVHGWKSGVIVSKFPGPVQGQEPVVWE